LETTTTKSRKKISNKVFALIIISIVTIAAFTGYLFLNQNGKDIVNITSFQKLEPETSPEPGELVNWPFKVTVENQGTRDVNYLTVRVIMYGNDQKLGEDIVQLGILKAHSERTIDLAILLDYVIFNETITCKATLERDGKSIGEINLA
jgi:hypothetical protein